MTFIGNGAHPDERRLLADIILAAHQPAGSAVDWSWRAVPRAREHRACLECGKLWPCPEVEWARQTKTGDLPMWTM